MDLKEIDIKPRLIAKIVAVEFALMIGLSFILSQISRTHYQQEGSGYKVFSKGDYSPRSTEDVPRHYFFVAVKYDVQGKALQEKYYTWIGDRVIVDYKGDKWSGASGLYLSNILLVAIPLFGFLLIAVTGQVLPITKTLKEDETAEPNKTVDEIDDAGDRLQYWGVAFFMSIFFAYPLKMILFGF